MRRLALVAVSCLLLAGCGEVVADNLSSAINTCVALHDGVKLSVRTDNDGNRSNGTFEVTCSDGTIRTVP